MIRLSELKLPLDASFDPPDAASPAPLYPPALFDLIVATLGVPAADISHWQVFKRSFDARKSQLRVVYIVDVALASPEAETHWLQANAERPHVQATPDMTWRAPVQAADIIPGDASTRPGDRPVVVGFGPCGLFAALVLAQMGFKPIVLERGPTVRQRTQDTWDLWRRRQLHPESNVQFGEGGAGTFSDGKLYSQIKDPRHLGRKVMEEFVQAGAPEDILYAAHPHIGTFKLVKVVEHLREQIKALGGEVRFDHRVVDIQHEPGPDGVPRLTGLVVFDQTHGTRHTLPARQVVMALGHSSRDTFAMLHHHQVPMESKPFSVGFRIEHPQSLIDRARWGVHAGHPLLGAADYKLVHHAQNGRAVYSFCMCPGGTVVAATSEPERVVTNGMSQYSRNERNANAGIVVGIDPRDYPHDEASLEAAFTPAPGTPPAAAMPSVRLHDVQAPGGFHPLSGVVLQRQLESHAYVLGGRNYEAPVQRVGDFVSRRASTSLGEVQPSYRPGVKPVSLDSALPTYAIEAIREALPVFGRKIKGFDLPDAVLTGVETRTSSPLRIQRDDGFESPGMRGLYPAGEGAGYAGGILSAGVDGIKVGEAVARLWTARTQG
jgi:uncharacterized FAD-dependent dehydrogenase